MLNLNLFVPVFLSVLKSSLTASVLILIVLAIQKVFNRKISVRVNSVIWLLVLVKLLIPVSDQMYTNYFEILYEKYKTAIQTDEAEDSSSTLYEDGFYKSNDLLENHKSFVLKFVKAASIIWVNGVLLLSLWLMVSQLNFIRKANCLKCSIDIRSLARKCNIKSNIPVYQCDEIKSPCILGIVKPKIYIPASVLNVCDSDQLSYIFLHELTHYKRKDLIYNFFSIIALFLHWFNPLVWVAVRQMNRYRELACDTCVLENLREEEKIMYGMTLLNLSKLYAVKQKVSELPVFFEANSQINDRIWQIKGFEKGSYKLKRKALFGCGIAAFIIFTNHLPVHALNTKNILLENSVTGWRLSEDNSYYYHGIRQKNIVVDGKEPGIDGVWTNQENMEPLVAEIPSDGWYLSPEDDKWYYLRNSSFLSGWVSQGDKWFYFDERGAMVNNTSLVMDGTEYIFDKTGMCLNKK